MLLEFQRIFLAFACSRDTVLLQSMHHFRMGLNVLTPVPHRWHLIIQFSDVSPFKNLSKMGLLVGNNRKSRGCFLDVGRLFVVQYLVCSDFKQNEFNAVFVRFFFSQIYNVNFSFF
jgi:hypothetical protein